MRFKEHHCLNRWRPLFNLILHKFGRRRQSCIDAFRSRVYSLYTRLLTLWSETDTIICGIWEMTDICWSEGEFTVKKFLWVVSSKMEWFSHVQEDFSFNSSRLVSLRNWVILTRLMPDMNIFVHACSDTTRESGKLLSAEERNDIFFQIHPRESIAKSPKVA